MILELRQPLDEVNIFSMDVQEVKPTEVYIDGVRVPKLLEEVIIAGLDVLAGIHGKSVLDIIKDGSVR